MKTYKLLCSILLSGSICCACPQTDKKTIFTFCTTEQPKACALSALALLGGIGIYKYQCTKTKDSKQRTYHKPHRAQKVVDLDACVRNYEKECEQERHP